MSQSVITTGGHARVCAPKTLLWVVVGLLFSQWVSAQPCIFPVFIPRTGVTVDPGEVMQPQEHHLMHSCTHLQGYPAAEKVAPIIHLPGTGSLDEMRTILIVNNTSASLPTNITIEYYDPNGVLLSTANQVIAPEGHYIETPPPAVAGRPFATVRVFKRFDSDPDIVGATEFHTYRVGVPVAGSGDPDADAAPDEEPIVEPEPEYEYYQEPHLRRMGAASMQQLQSYQDHNNQLFWGPIPISNGTGNGLAWDFMEGVCPLLMVTNPLPTATTINVLIFDDQLNTIAAYSRPLAGFASWCDMGFFEGFVAAHFPPPGGYDSDICVFVSAETPIIGQGVMFDFFGQGMEFLERFRMGSTMMANSTPHELVSPEFVAETTAIATNTLIGFANMSFGDIGPVNIDFRDRNGVVTTTTIASFPAFSMRRLGPGVLGYPPVEFAGSITIRACQPGLIGWSMRSTEHPGAPGSDEAIEVGVEFELQKVWGEVLDGGNGVEPGKGWVAGADGFTRKLGPLNIAFRDTPTTPLPSYNHVYNNGVSNTGQYSFRFFDAMGADFTDPLAPQPFAGLTIGDTSFTYIDNPAVLPLVANPTPYDFYNSKFEHKEPSVVGVDAIGGYIYLWPEVYEEPLIPPPAGTYFGPCDVVGNPPFWCL